jgi:copper(I)-binding protein
MRSLGCLPVAEQRSWFVFAAVRRIGVGLAVGVALLTSACAAGQHAHTASERPTLPGANADLGPIHLRTALIAPPSGTATFFPTGSDLSVTLVIVNSGSKDDELTSVSSPAVTSWGSYATAADAAAVISAQSASSSPQPGASGSASDQPAPTPSTSVKIPAGSRVSWGTPEAKGALVFSQTTQELRPGTTIPVTFTFANAGSVTVAVPIGLSKSAHTSVIPVPSTSTIEG